MTVIDLAARLRANRVAASLARINQLMSQLRTLALQAMAADGPAPRPSNAVPPTDQLPNTES